MWMRQHPDRPPSSQIVPASSAKAPASCITRASPVSVYSYNVWVGSSVANKLEVGQAFLYQIRVRVDYNGIIFVPCAPVHRGSDLKARTQISCKFKGNIAFLQALVYFFCDLD